MIDSSAVKLPDEDSACPGADLTGNEGGSLVGSSESPAWRL